MKVTEKCRYSRGLLIVMVVLWLVPLRADDTRVIELASGAEITVEQIGEGRERILWLPSEYGLHGEVERSLAKRVAEQGFSVWLVDLHGSYFIPWGRSSLDEIPRQDIRELISAAQPDDGRLYLFSYGRGAALALQAVRLWQLHESPLRPPLGGVLLLHPNLMAGTAVAGAEPQFAPITLATNLPLFILQPGNSAKRWYLDALVARLHSGGSDVFTRYLADVSDGFQVSDDATSYELEMRERLPAMLSQSARLLRPYNKAPRQPGKILNDSAGRKETNLADNLRLIEGWPLAPPLKLSTIDGGVIDLKMRRGEVVLLNFWATWCPPCVKEIPSLGRLAKRLSTHPFSVISVDVGEKDQLVRDFLREVPAAFPVLLDPEGTTVDAWKIRAFPTSFVIDREGRLRYGYFGGLEWDDEAVVALIEGLLAE
jgi:thiol-disulfide isomerase/thioredoxin